MKKGTENMDGFVTSMSAENCKCQHDTSQSFVGNRYLFMPIPLHTVYIHTCAVIQNSLMRLKSLHSFYKIHKFLPLKYIGIYVPHLPMLFLII